MQTDPYVGESQANSEGGQVNEDMVERIREGLAGRDDVEEKRMFGVLTFMVSGYVCCGVSKTDLMFRVGEEEASAALGEAGVRPMDITGRPLKGMVFVDPAGDRRRRGPRGLGRTRAPVHADAPAEVARCEAVAGGAAGWRLR